MSPEYAPEMVRVLDWIGEPTRQVVTKKQACMEGIPHPTVHIWAVNLRTGEIGVGVRSQTVSYPGTYHATAAGHVQAEKDRDETPKRAAKREMWEEINVRVLSKQLVHLGQYHVTQGMPQTNVPKEQWPIHNAWADVFVVDWNILKCQEIHLSEDVDRLLWIPLAEFKKQIMGEGYRQYLPHSRSYYTWVIWRIEEEIGRRRVSGGGHV